MAVVTAQHHSAQRCCSIATQTVDSLVASRAATAASPLVEYLDPAPVAPAPVIEYVAPAPAVTCAAPAPVVGYVAPATAVTCPAPAPVIGYVAPVPSVTHATPASVFEYVAPAPVLEYIAPTPAVSFVAPSQQLRPASSPQLPLLLASTLTPSLWVLRHRSLVHFLTAKCFIKCFFVAPSQQLRPASTAAAVTTGVNLDAEFVGSASQVVGSLPHGEVFHQVHQVPLAGGEIPENLVLLGARPGVPRRRVRQPRSVTWLPVLLSWWCRRSVALKALTAPPSPSSWPRTSSCRRRRRRRR